MMSHPVLVGVDGSGSSLAAADWGAGEAALRGVPLRLVHATPSFPDHAVGGEAVDRLHARSAQMLQRMTADLSDRCPDTGVLGEQADGDPAAVLLAAARDAGLLVVGTRGTGGFDGLAVGWVALRVAAAAPCPVVLVPQPARTVGQGTQPARGAAEVVLGFDARDPVGEAADFAFTSAGVRRAGLRVVQAWALPAEAALTRTVVVTEEDRATWEDQEVLRLSDALRRWREKYPDVAVGTDVVLLHPAEALLHTSHGAALLVVGRRSDPHAPEGRLGRVTHAVLHHARCPVAVVPHAG
jgi:nucleotide-binding universal stress UspA family protein